jgi:outer membrane biosynthesis protein TonB
MSRWTLFSNHGHVLLFLANDPEARLRDVASAVGITERSVQKIVRDLQDGGIISVSKRGRRNRYRVHSRKPLRHELESHRTVGSLVRLMSGEKKARKRRVAEEQAPVGPVKPPWVDDHAAPPSASKPRAEPAPPKAAEPTPAPAPVPEPEPPAPPERETAPPDTAPARPAGKRKPARKKAPADDQQGSLF